MPETTSEPFGLPERRNARARRVPTVLAPALPALILLAVTTAGTVDPPLAGLKAQLHLTSVNTAITGPVTPRGTASWTLTVTPR